MFLSNCNENKENDEKIRGAIIVSYQDTPGVYEAVTWLERLFFSEKILFVLQSKFDSTNEDRTLQTGSQ